MKAKTIKIKSPATVANMVCGFDILGFAVRDVFDEMELTLIEKRKIEIHHIDNFLLPHEPEKNVAGVALQALMIDFKMPANIGFNVKINKLIMPGSGLGSSAASAAGAVVGANILLGNIFSKTELVQFAMEGEALASGSRHADNVAPCIFGGVTLVRSANPLDIISISFPDLFVAIIHPQIEVKTADARNILPKQIDLKTAVSQWGNVAGLVAGLMKNDLDLIARSMHDAVAEPFRKNLIHGFEEVKNNCMKAGAIGGGISGSGPSIFMFCRSESTAKNVETEMKKVYDRLKIDYKSFVTTISKAGVHATNA